MIAWLLMLFVLAYFYERTFGSDIGPLRTAFLEMSTANRLLVVLFALLTAWLFASAALEARKVRNREGELKQLRERLNGLRLAVTMSAEQQRDAERATQVILHTDPEAMLMALQNRINETERQVASQGGYIGATDLQERVKAIQSQQDSLREEIGKVVEARLANAPLFSELKWRQDQVERALAELESVGGGTSLSDRLTELANTNANVKERTDAAKEALTTVSRLKGDLDDYKGSVLSLQDENSGLSAIVDMTRSSQRELNRALDKLELCEDEGGLSRRVERLVGEKCEAEQRVAIITQTLGTIREAREEIVTLDRKRRNIEQSLAEAEVDEGGYSVAKRLSELTAFAVEAQRRIVVLQDMLRQLKEQEIALTNSQADLEPLIRENDGIKSHVAAASNLHGALARSLDELETDGPTTLSARVEGLSQDKRVVEKRIEALNEVFGKVAAIETDINTLLMSVLGSLSAHAPINVWGCGNSSAFSGERTPQQEGVTQGIPLGKENSKSEWTNIFKRNGAPWRHKREEK
jgi:hypothetical protein